MQRRRFTEEFKHEAVKLARQPGASVAAIARDLGIGANLLGRWVREQTSMSGTVPSNKLGTPSLEEFERMRRELAKVKVERDILKKALVGSTGECNISDLILISELEQCREQVDLAYLYSKKKSYGIDGRTVNRLVRLVEPLVSMRDRFMVSCPQMVELHHV